MARRGQSQAPDPGVDSRSAGFPPIPSPTPHTPISAVSPPSRTSQSTLFLALLFKCRLRVCRKKIPLTQEMGYWGTTGFCININGGGRQCPSCALAWAHSCPRNFFLAGGGAAAASTSEPLTVMALLVASLPLLLPLPLPLPLLLPLPPPLPPSLPLPVHDPASDSG